MRTDTTNRLANAFAFEVLSPEGFEAVRDISSSGAVGSR